jgi:hypothetical protein
VPLHLNRSAQSVSPAVPAPRLAAGFGVRTVPAVPTLTLRFGSARACCPALRRRYLSKTAAARPGPPWVSRLTDPCGRQPFVPKSPLGPLPAPK